MSRRTKVRVDREGTIYEDPPGFRVAIMVNGRLLRRRAKDKDEALAILRQIREEHDRIAVASRSRQTLGAWLEHWLVELLPGTVRAKTLEGYADTCKRYITPYLGHIRLDRLTKGHVQAWLKLLSKTKVKTKYSKQRQKEGDIPLRTLSAATVANAHRRLQRALKAAEDAGLLTINVAKGVDRPKPDEVVTDTDEEEKVRALDQSQIKALLAALRGHRLYALFALDCTLGLRRGELIGLRWRNVRLDGPKAHIRVREQLQRLKNEATGKRERVRVTTKTKAGARTVPLSAALVDLLLTHREQQKHEREAIGESWHGEDLVFTSEIGGPINERNLLRTLKRALRRAQLPDVSLHSLRHSASSIMMANGGKPVDVAAILGHSSPEITVRIYAHSFDEGQQEAVEGASSILGGDSVAGKAPDEPGKPADGQEAEK